VDTPLNPQATKDNNHVTKPWAEQFQPVISAGVASGRKLVERPQQAELGQAMIDAFENKTPLIAEAPTGTGKSFAALVPMIHAVLKAKAAGEEKRGVISTETLSLQDQVSRKDLPFLATLYPGFTFRLLKGRSNYVCFEAADSGTLGNQPMRRLYDELVRHKPQLGDGEKTDVERVLKRELTEHEWGFLSSSMAYCGESTTCDGEKCYSTRARALAANADIVVINHALLHAHVESGFALLGQVDYLVVDEAHTLETVFIDSWTDSISPWELGSMHGKVSTALDKSRRAMDLNPALVYSTERAMEAIQDTLDAVLMYYSLYYSDQDWRDLSEALSEKTVHGTGNTRLVRAMEIIEEKVPGELEKTEATLERAQKHLERTLETMRDQEMKGIRDISKGITAAKSLRRFCSLVREAIKTKDGVVVEYGVPYGVIVDGFERRSGEPGVRLRTVPLDVSSRLDELWGKSTPVLLSATLSDLTEGSFRYLKASLGFPPATELRTLSPFDYDVQQLAYITRGQLPRVDTVHGAKYSFDELVHLLEASKGRALVLFTARSELDDAAARLLQLRAAGDFDHPVLVQTRDANKRELARRFHEENSSVLLGLKSFFTGVDFPGDTCSLVVLCKFPLPRFDITCRQKVAWWQRRNFPRWYEREALTVFQQAAGRLIRSGEDRGVVAILDQRVTDRSERVFQTASIGVQALGSKIVRSPDDVRQFLS
jgi:ATP-dependent DNA helicase DinG